MPAEHPPGGRLDGAVERLGRWTAARTTRRGFLGRLGRVLVLVASGPALATLLADRAEARVCGQSGVSPRCATFDCDETWGWCWYASGCCLDGALKKICDCCAPNTPNPRGYCPAGTEVLCIVESCGADPRLQTRAVRHIPHADPVAAAVGVSQARYQRAVPIAVVGEAQASQAAAVAASVGGVVGGPVLLTSRDRLDDAVAAELARLGVEFVKVVGAALDPAIDGALTARGITAQRIGADPDPEGFAAEVAAWSRSMTGARTALAVMPGAPDVVVASAAALAHARRLPLVLGAGDNSRAALLQDRPVHTTYVVSADAGDAAAFPGGRPLTAPTAEGLAAAVGDLALGLGVPGTDVVLACRDHPLTAAAAAALPGPLLLHRPGTLDGARDWLFTHRGGIAAAYPVGDAAVFTPETRYELQSIINEFETHLLTGSAGEGLPVIPQPPEERPIGRARR